MGQEGSTCPLEPNRVDTLMGLGKRRERWPHEHLSGEKETAASQAPPRGTSWLQEVVLSIPALLGMRPAERPHTSVHMPAASLIL